MNLKSVRLCFIGNMLGQNAQHITTQGQILADLFASEGYQVKTVSSKVNRLARMIEILLTLIKHNRKFDLVLLEVYSGLYFIIADLVSLLCKIFRLPLVMVLHGGSLPEFVHRYPRWSKRVLKRADRLVAPSAFLAERIGAAGYEITVISNIIDLNLYPYRERREISPRLIWMRSFHPIYNPEMAVKVLEELRLSVPEATMTMAGVDKGLENDIKKSVKEKGLSESVRFAGFLDLEKKLEEFSRADIYINTNQVDNMPVSVIEARALGLPVVATNVGGVPFLIENGENGFLVQSDDAPEMVKAIKKLLDSPELTQKISRNGKIAAEGSAWSSVQKDWEKLIREILLERNATKNKFRLFGDRLKAEKLKR